MRGRSSVPFIHAMVAQKVTVACRNFALLWRRVRPAPSPDAFRAWRWYPDTESHFHPAPLFAHQSVLAI
jgi:hypothetical protein